MMDASIAVPVAEPEESDFSPRKLRISFAIAVGTLFGSTVLPFTAQALLLLPMTQEFHWSRTVFSLGLSAMMLGGMFSAPLLGRLVDRIGVRRVLISGTVLVGLMTMALSRQNGALWQYLGGFFVLGAIGSSAIGYQKVLGALFNKHRGKAMAIFGVESSLATAVSVPIILWLLDHKGWRGTFVGMGIVILLTVPLLLVWMAEPDPPRAAMTPQPDGAAPVIPGMTTGEALRDRTFWLVTFAGVLAIIPAMGLMQHMVPYLVSKGIGMEAASWRITVMSVAMALGTVVGGWCLDISESPRIAVPFAVLSTLAQLGMLFLSGSAAGVAVLTVSIAVMGFAGGAKRPMATYFQLRFFGLRDFAGITGVQAFFIAFGMLIAPPLVGYCYDRFGTYVPALWAMVGLMGLTILTYQLLGPYRFSRDLTEVPPAG